ncbi:MAG: molybdopterin biosynthesis protein [Thermodesulfovibrionales bacterium]|nr:molybdopterin biosynthesis protein [Thermodesulfovibrionales bacterium]
MKEIFHKVSSLSEALSILKRLVEELGFLPLGQETIKTVDSIGRITTRPVFARYSSPFFHSSAMDGYAVRFKDTLSASEGNPLLLKINSDALYVDTGDPLPIGFDAVVMVEDVNIEGEYIEIYSPVKPYQNVRTVGEDIVATELIIPERHIIRGIDASAMVASGVLDVDVRKQPICTIIPTGTEIVEPETVRHKPPTPPQIIEYNSIFISSMIEDTGGITQRGEIIKDDKDLLASAILDATLDSHVVIVIAGSGKGSEDFTADVIRQNGRLMIHGVSIKPGKPFISGIINNKLVIGIPGYPVSAFVCMRYLVLPVLRWMLGIDSLDKKVVRANISRQLSSKLGVDEFVRVKIGAVGEKTIASPVGRGAGLMMSVVRADGILTIPQDSEGLWAGSEVDIELIRDIDDIKNTIVCIGSHDNALDLLANHIKSRFPKYSLSSSHVGSMGGIMAIKRGEAHIAGCHLLDETTGVYNIPYLKKYLNDKKVIHINFLKRTQGLIVQKGNPKDIKGFQDLLREDVTFINRQSGSGTRLLLDKHLKDLGIEASKIKGYDKEEFTHMAVASAVLTGIADTGLAVLSSARALGLDFIPVAQEDYDLIIDMQYIDTEPLKILMSIISEDIEFRKQVEMLGGYDTKDMGRVVYKTD